jgi:2-keto-4-pentenoate hydratase/2-oxohepta-3-ene-1,7-dioic acid hydratase in catechol pathway
MKLASYRHSGRTSVGLVIDDLVFDVPSLRGDAPDSMRELLAWLDTHPGALDDVDPPRDGGIALGEITFLPVVPDPQAVWCAALTYLSHIREAPNRSAPEYPLFFLRVANSQLGHNEAMVAPSVSGQLDYEGELAVVIGRGGRHIPQDAAREHIAGYTCYNDGSVRDWQRHTSQITPGKNFAATGGFGPWLVTADEFGDPSTHQLQTRLNGNVVQQASISELLFSVDYMIHYLSTICPLEVGDVIVTGTCGGVGVRRDPPVFLKAGDLVEVEIDGIGVLSNPVMAEKVS